MARRPFLAIGPDTDGAPSGVWVRHRGNQTIYGARHLSWGSWWVIIPTLLFILPVGIAAATNPIETWFQSDNIGALLGCVAVVILYLVFCASPLLGKSEFTVQRGEVKLFEGVGFIGWRHRFFLANVTSILTLFAEGGKNPVVERGQIKLRNGNSIIFGTGLTTARRYFLIGKLGSLTNKKS